MVEEKKKAEEKKKKEDEKEKKEEEDEKAEKEDLEAKIEAAAAQKKNDDQPALAPPMVRSTVSLRFDTGSILAGSKWPWRDGQGCQD